MTLTMPWARLAMPTTPNTRRMYIKQPLLVLGGRFGSEANGWVGGQAEQSAAQARGLVSDVRGAKRTHSVVGVGIALTNFVARDDLQTLNVWT